MSYTWDSPAGRYRDDKGQFVDRKTVYGFSDSSINSGADFAAELAKRVSAGTISVDDWHFLMRGEIKSEVISQYLWGIGGRDRIMNSPYRDNLWGKTGPIVKEQYQYLKKFAAEIAAGTLTEGQIAQRSAMYINSAREALEMARSMVAQEWGAEEVRWLTGAVATEHCDDCLANEALGWQPLGAFPLPGKGETKCLTSCRCSLEYRKKPVEPGTEGEIWGG